MRARWTYFSTGTLVAIALGAPFVLPRALDSHGSAAFALQALAPPQAQNAVVHMDALPQPKRARRVQRVAVRTAVPRVVVSRASLASVRSQAAPTVARKTAPHHPVAHVNHWYPKHRPAPVDTARAPAPPPPPTPVVAVQPQPVNLNSSSDQPAAAPAQPVAVLASVPQNDQGSSGGGDENGNGNGNGHDKGHGRGNGHGHDHGD